MGLEKAIKHGKEKRKPYKGSKSFDKTCRNHGACNYCKNKRTFFDKKERTKANDKLKEYNNGEWDL